MAKKVSKRQLRQGLRAGLVGLRPRYGPAACEPGTVANSQQLPTDGCSGFCYDAHGRLIHSPVKNARETWTWDYGRPLGSVGDGMGPTVAVLDPPHHESFPDWGGPGATFGERRQVTAFEYDGKPAWQHQGTRSWDGSAGRWLSDEDPGVACEN